MAQPGSATGAVHARALPWYQRHWQMRAEPKLHADEATRAWAKGRGEAEAYGQVEVLKLDDLGLAVVEDVRTVRQQLSDDFVLQTRAGRDFAWLVMTRPIKPVVLRPCGTAESMESLWEQLYVWVPDLHELIVAGSHRPDVLPPTQARR